MPIAAKGADSSRHTPAPEVCMQVSLRARSVNTDGMNACRVLQPGNPQLSGAIPLGTPYPVLRYNGPSGYSMCSQFPCARKPSYPLL